MKRARGTRQRRKAQRPDVRSPASARLAEVEAALAEALKQQAATSEILRVISSSPADPQPVFETIARNALRLCNGRYSAVFRSEGRLVHMVAQQNFNAAALEHAGRVYPTSIDGPGLAAAVVREARLNHVSDVESDPRITPEALEIPRSLG